MNRLIIFLKLELLGDLYWQLHKNKNKKWTYLSIFFQECLMCRNTAIIRFTEFKEYSGVYIVPTILKAYPSQIWKSSQIFTTKLPFFASHFPFLAQIPLFFSLSLFSLLFSSFPSHASLPLPSLWEYIKTMHSYGNFRQVLCFGRNDFFMISNISDQASQYQTDTEKLQRTCILICNWRVYKTRHYKKSLPRLVACLILHGLINN